MKFNNPVRGKLVLPVDCFDLTSFEWSDAPANIAPASKPKRSFADFQKTLQAAEVMPEPVQFKSLADTFSELVLRVRGFKRPVNPLAEVFSK